MAFVYEDGTGKADANSFASVAFADAYFADRSIATWTGTDAEKQACLVKATDYIEGRFGLRFKGEKETELQALAFPRTGVSGMPVNLLKATSEYALRAKAAALAPDPKMDASGLAIVGIKKKVGPIETDTQFATSGSGSVPATFRPYPSADMLLAGLINSSRTVIRG